MPAVSVRGLTNVATRANLTGLNATTGVTVAWWQRHRGFGATSTSISGDIFVHASTANPFRDGYFVGWSAGLLQVLIGGSAGSNTQSMRPFVQAYNRWNHFAITFNDANDQLCFYMNGVLMSMTTNTRDMTANAACTTIITPNASVGSFRGDLFDLQVFPDLVIPARDILLLMDPRQQLAGLKGRYFGLRYNAPAASGTIIDESGSGNDLTASATAGAVTKTDEPPWRPTYQ